MHCFLCIYPHCSRRSGPSSRDHQTADVLLKYDTVCLWYAILNKSKNMTSYQHSQFTSGTPTDAEVIVSMFGSSVVMLVINEIKDGFFWKYEKQPTIEMQEMLIQLTNNTEASLAQTAGGIQSAAYQVLRHAAIRCCTNRLRGEALQRAASPLGGRGPHVSFTSTG